MPNTFPDPSPAPETLADGRYKLMEPLGTGGMAIVYRVLDHWTGTHCALKLLLPARARSPKTRQRFLHEARTMAHLDHPNIVRILDVGTDAGHDYFVTELAAGGSVAHLLVRHGPRTGREALSFAYQTLQALDYAHAAGVVHRDVKPHNMLLDLPGSAEPTADQVLKLTDFGTARVLATADSSRITGTGDTLGTLAYMAPEQRVNARGAGPTADVYGVGASLYIMATGRRPFDLALASLDPTVLDRLSPTLRPIVRKATAHLPGDRYPSAAAMAEAVQEAWRDLPEDDDTPGATELEPFAMDGATTIIRVSTTQD